MKVCQGALERSENYLKELLLSFYHVGAGDGTQASKLGGKRLYPLSHKVRSLFQLFRRYCLIVQCQYVEIPFIYGIWTYRVFRDFDEFASYWFFLLILRSTIQKWVFNPPWKLWEKISLKKSSQTSRDHLFSLAFILWKPQSSSINAETDYSRLSVMLAPLP